MVNRSLILLFLFLSGTLLSSAQKPDSVYKPYIHSIRFHMYGDQLSDAIYNLNGNNRLELDFDDMDGNVKYFYYTLVLCDYDWVPVDLSSFDYLKGFTQQRLSTYRYSSISLTRYTHYQAFIPEQNSGPTRSGNFLLKVYLDGDTSKLVFTRRLLVLDQKAAVSGQVVQPFNPQLFRTHQKIQFNVSLAGINAFSAAQQVKVVILQNSRWDNCIRDIAPTFVRGSSLEYSAENNCVFPGGKEWRWLDLRSLILQSDRVDHGEYNKKSTELFLKPDIDRSGIKYTYYRDQNGFYNMETYESINPYWQADYATVHFYLSTPDGKPYPGRDIYLAGQLTNYELNDKTRMIFNESKGLYEITSFLKQGYYDYTYISSASNNPSNRTELEGNYWETENSYTILVYYRSFTDRADQLIGAAKINSRSDRPGFSF